MLERIKRHSANGLSAMTAIFAFMIVLPLTLAITLFMLIAGIAAIATRRYQLRKSGVSFNRQKATVSASHTTQGYPQKAPIEGSYTVVDS